MECSNEFPKRSSTQRLEAMRQIAPRVELLLAEHRQKRRLWFPADHLPIHERENGDYASSLQRLRDRARSIPDAVRVALAINMITEEGLPHFHRLLDSHIGEESPWRQWNYMWTAEEDRHGTVLRDYIRDVALVDMRQLESLQFEYITAGFDPAWNRDPYRVFVFTTLQERATQISHQNTFGSCKMDEPVLRGILQCIAQDEARHYAFYRAVVGELFRVDSEGMLESAAHIMPRIDMPGLNVPGFAEMGDVLRREGVYTPWHYKEIVEECLRYWKIEQMTGLSSTGQKAQASLLAVPRRIEKIAKYIDSKQGGKSFSFAVIHGRTLKYA
jgi:acyl-[acyl-carrier-protein] desaturase